jgi:hypothetical protein
MERIAVMGAECSHRGSRAERIVKQGEAGVKTNVHNIARQGDTKIKGLSR